MTAKLWSIIATVGFGALTIGGVFAAGVLDPVGVSRVARGLAIGADAQAGVERVTRAMKVGRVVRQAEGQAA